MSTAPPASAPWARRFFAIWTGQAFSLLGSALVQFALIWWLTSSTGSATVLATATLFGVLPQVVIGPFAGALVDRWNRRAVLMAADSLVAVTTLGLILLSAAGLMQVWHIYAAMLLRATFGAFQFPAFGASTSLMVPDAHLARVSGLNQGIHGLMSIVAPPLGALLLGVLPLRAVLAVDLVTAAFALLPLLFIAIPQPAQRDLADHARLRFHHTRDYGVLQKLAYASVLFVALPLMILTGLSMSPGFNAAAPWLLDLFQGRQTARTVHFLTMLALIGFFAVHVAMILLAGPLNEMRSILTGWYRTDEHDD